MNRHTSVWKVAFGTGKLQNYPEKGLYDTFTSLQPTNNETFASRIWLKTKYTKYKQFSLKKIKVSSK